MSGSGGRVLLVAAAAAMMTASGPGFVQAQQLAEAPVVSCAEDLTGDGFVSTNDLLYLLASFNRPTSQPAAAAADLDGVRVLRRAPAA